MPRYPSATPTLFIIGGAEDRVGRAALLRRFVRLSGGRRSRLVVIPTASSFQSEVVDSYRQVFGRFGVEAIDVVNPQSRREAHDPDAVSLLDEATGIFMSGGSQLRLSQFFPGTPLGDALHRAHARGAVVAGTSAGASKPGSSASQTSGTSASTSSSRSRVTRGASTASASARAVAAAASTWSDAS